MLVDKFGRKHDYLRISLTDKCNLRCNYCMPENPCFLPNKKLLQNEEIVQIARMFINEFSIKKIRFTGGEPLLRNNLLDIIEPLSRMPIELGITTNGVLLDRHIDGFKTVGAIHLNVSLDSLCPERYQSITGYDHFKKVFDNIQYALSENFHVKINVVIKTGLNEDEILDFIDWTKNDNVHVRFIEFMPFNGNSWNWDKVYSFQRIIDQIESKHAIHKLSDDSDSTAKTYQAEGHRGSFGIISTISHPFCTNCNRIRLTADGKLKNCLFSQDEIDLLSPYRTGVDIRPMIIKAMTDKFAERGGETEFTNSEGIDSYNQGRTMTSIGG